MSYKIASLVFFCYCTILVNTSYHISYNLVDFSSFTMQARHVLRSAHPLTRTSERINCQLVISYRSLINEKGHKICQLPDCISINSPLSQARFYSSSLDTFWLPFEFLIHLPSPSSFYPFIHFQSSNIYVVLLNSRFSYLREAIISC